MNPLSSLLPSPIRRVAVAVAAAAAVALPPPAAQARTGADAALARTVQRHADCTRPAFSASAVDLSPHPGYVIEVRGEPYRVAIDARAAFALLLPGSDEAVAQVKVDRPPTAAFDEQASWRQRWLEDVAGRAGVVPTRQPLPGGAALITVNKPVLAGRAVGLSLLIDPRRRLFVQWDWPILPRYAGIEDALAMQAAVRGRLVPCVLEA